MFRTFQVTGVVRSHIVACVCYVKRKAMKICRSNDSPSRIKWESKNKINHFKTKLDYVRCDAVELTSHDTFSAVASLNTTSEMGSFVK